MFKFFSTKNISVAAITIAMLFGTLAVSPVSTAFAKSGFNKSFYVKQGAAVTSHRRTGLVYDGATYSVRFRSAFKLGNRSISHQ